MANLPLTHTTPNASVNITTPGSVSITSSSVATTGYITAALNGIIPNNTAATSDGMVVHGTVSAKDVNIDGVSLKETLSAIQARLAILVPDPVLLEKYEALRNAYETYKTLEALCK